MKIVDRIRRIIPEGFRNELKERTTLSYLIAPLYGYVMLPSFDGRAKIYGEKNKFFVHPDISAIDCLREIYKENVYERFRGIKQGDIIIDIGANVGMFTVKAAMKVGNERSVVAIEPNSQNLKLLKRNVNFHKLSNVITISSAVGSFSGKTKLLATPVSGQSKLIVDEECENATVEWVQMSTIDEITQRLGINRVDFMKIDTEGSELDILRGGGQNCLKFTKYIAMECNHFPGEEEEVKQFLEEMGFNVYLENGMCYASNESYLTI